MKAKEAPEKIYLYPSIFKNGKILGRWFKTRYNQDRVEYVRADAFVEKIWDWIEDNLLSSDQQDKSRTYCEQFRNYMKGE